MQNITTKVVGSKLVIEVDLTKDLGPSKSGKSINIATTAGNISVDGAPGVKLGLNCYKGR